MQQNARKRHTVCRKCKTRYTGAYCPYCGTEAGLPRAHRARGGLFVALLRFLLSLIILAVLLATAFITLDYIASAGGDAHSTARAILDSARNAIPQSVLDTYAAIKTAYLDRWVAAVTGFFTIVFE